MLKQKLAQRQLTVGSWLTLGHPAIAEIMVDAGFDWVAVDLEHSAISIAEAEQLIRVIERSGATPLVRLTTNNADLIKRVMDAGAHGIIVPQVNTVADAQAAIDAMYYPPHGSRGVGLARAQGYGACFEEYCEWLASEAVCIVQIEHKDAIPHCRDIFSLPAVDGYFIGPYDLSASMGMPGELQAPQVSSAIAQIRQTANEVGLAGGVHVVEPDPELLQKSIDLGFSFIAYSLDTRILDAGCRAIFESVEETEDAHSCDHTCTHGV